MSFIRAKQRSLTAITPHNANRRYIIPKRQRTLLFAGDTFIEMPDVTIIINNALQAISYTARLDDYAAANKTIWSESAGNNDGTWNVSNESYRVSRDAAPVVLITVEPLRESVEYSAVEAWGPIGTLTVSVPGLPSESTIVPGTGPIPAGVWRIGSRSNSPAQNWIGMIRDFRIFNDAGAVIHHWPINDNVEDGGIIRDVIGGQDGILTLGSGAWR